MSFLKTVSAATGLAVLLATPAMAIPLTGTFGITVYQGTNPVPGSAANASQQALPSAIAAISGRTTTSLSYAGNLAFFLGGGGTDTVAAFLNSGGGTTTGTPPAGAFSGAGYTNVTLMKITFSLPSLTAGTITHDDGISLFASGNTTVNLLPGNSAPTVASGTSYALGAGTYDLYYSEVNGLPATLNFDILRQATVPEPMSLALVGAGLLGAGLMRRKSAQV